MVLYIEANFVLELVFDQEESPFVEQIIACAESGTLELRLPTLALFEPEYRVEGQRRQRRGLRDLLERERKHLVRLRLSALPVRRIYGRASIKLASA